MQDTFCNISRRQNLKGTIKPKLSLFQPISVSQLVDFLFLTLQPTAPNPKIQARSISFLQSVSSPPHSLKGVIFPTFSHSFRKMAFSIAAAGTGAGAGALASSSANCYSSTKLTYLSSLQFPRELRRLQIGNCGLKSNKGTSRLVPLVFLFISSQIPKLVFSIYSLKLVSFVFSCVCLILYVNFL